MSRTSATLRGTALAALATAAAAATVVPASAVGYAGTPPVQAPAGSFPSTAASATTQAGAPLTLSNSTMSLLVPADVLPAGTQVTVLNGNPTQLQSLLPSGQSFVAGYAVGWIAPDGSSPDATAPLTFTVTDTRLTGTESAYQTTSTGLAPTTANESAGHASFSFTKDPGFVLASAVSAPIGPGNTGGGAIGAQPSTLGTAAPIALVAGGVLIFGGLSVRRRRLR